jgi:tRNA nucleotidyltransferase/poly(A) polymerase
MKEFLPDNLIRLALSVPFPLYVVGGSVRDFLAGYAVAAEDFSDWDICAPVSAEDFSAAAEKCGFFVRSVYKNTGTVKLTDDRGRGYEFTSFRSDEYVRGEHTPAKIYFTENILSDARRRDFTCNAVYYYIAKDSFVDPLGGMEDIRKKQIRTVRAGERVFGEDGLRLLRLARQCAQTGFVPEEETMQGATMHADLIGDIAPERIFNELNLLLHADEKYGVKDGPYQGLCILRQTGVLRYILPELAAGNGMVQRADFHSYDVLEHTFRCVRYAPPSVRWAALLHDVGKPFCMVRDGNVHAHPEEGERIAREVLSRLKAPKELTNTVCELVRWHMYDMDGRTKDGKLRRFILEHREHLEDLLSLMQADYSACKDDFSVSPHCEHIRMTYERMQEQGVPFTVKELKIGGKTLLEEGIPAPHIGRTLNELLKHCAMFPEDNTAERLLKLAFAISRNL